MILYVEEMILVNDPICKACALRKVLFHVV